MKMPILVRLGVSSAAVGLACLPAFLMPACLSNSDNSNGNDASAGGGSSSGGGGGSSSGGGTVADSGGDAGGGATCNLDDMSGPATSTMGYWFTYSDRTCPNTSLLLPDAAGTISPGEGYASDPAVDDGGNTLTAMLPGVGMGVGYREFIGGGETTWGVGFGFNFTNNGTDPFTVCPASTCTGTPPMVDASAGFGAPYDASQHKGISFFARSLMATATLPTKVRVQISDKHTDPGSGSPEAGPTSGICNQCASTGTAECANDYYTTVNLSSTWAQYTVNFADLATDTWAATYAKGTIDLKTLYHVHWQINKPVANFDIQLACISWVD
ncbi:MAG: hypothetical protein WBY94_15490 [Polyangiaceae bacterium]